MLVSGGECIVKRLYMYGHGGCKNHGCEAIVKSTMAMVAAQDREYEYVISSLDKQADERFLHSERIVEIYPDSYTTNPLLRKWYGLRRRFLGDDEIVGRKTYKNFRKSLKSQPKDTVFLSIGGDNYCCEKPSWLYYSNRLIDRLGFKRVLWGCSVEPKTISQEMIDDLDGYSLITVRESATLQALQGKLKKAKVVAVSDMAFTIAKEDSGVVLPPHTIGVNLSPIITQRGANNAAQESFRNLIRYLLSETDFHIAFIPHVVIDGNNDADVMKPFFDEIAATGRATMIGTDYSYAQLRDIISQCETVVCSRTHASISAYACCVPTLVIGYSVKSIGIARDLFGTEEGYVISMSDLKGGQELVSAFENMQVRNREIREHLQKIMPTYIEKAYFGVESLLNL